MDESSQSLQTLLEIEVTVSNKEKITLKITENTSDSEESYPINFYDI